jgi:peptidoglycan-associated lipoprotein
MSVLAKKIIFLLSAATLVLATGCNKKPVRPDPGQTAMGVGAGPNSGYNDTLNATGVDTYGALLADANSGLMPKGDGYYEDDDMIMGLLEPVYFDFDQSGIKASERIKLEAAMDYLAANPGYRLLLEGHCDWRGTADYNLGLGDRRAGAARQFLETAGVSSALLETASKGDLEATENGGEAQMSLDRKVELIVLKR